MEPPIEGKLEWPPRAEDLRRLYIDEHLSAAKIAARYGLEYASPKTAESTILYHLKRNGITRRDKAELARKVTEQMVDAWVKRYEAGESLKQIAGSELSPVTVFLHLKKRGLRLRDKVEAQIEAVTKHPRTAFCGNPIDRAYLLGFARGDLWVTTHGRAIRIKGGSTHQAFVELFRQLFGRYGAIYVYPKEAKVTGYEWSMDADLDTSFRFLLDREQQELDAIIADTPRFYSYLGGLFDAEGSIFYHRKGSGGAFELTLTNMDLDLLVRIRDELLKLGYSSKLDRNTRNNQKYPIKGSDHIWRICVWRHKDLNRLLGNMVLRHSEKVAKRDIAMRLESRPRPDMRMAVLREWQKLLDEIEASVEESIKKAKEAALSSLSTH